MGFSEFFQSTFAIEPLLGSASERTRRALIRDCTSLFNGQGDERRGTGGVAFISCLHIAWSADPTLPLLVTTVTLYGRRLGTGRPWGKITVVVASMDCIPCHQKVCRQARALPEPCPSSGERAIISAVSLSMSIMNIIPDS